MILKTMQPYWGLSIILGFWSWKSLKTLLTKKKLPEFIQQGAIIIDVRSPSEFAVNANSASVNIPLNELNSKISTLDNNKPIIVCCASGARSACAAAILKKKGLKVINAGSWRNTIL